MLHRMSFRDYQARSEINHSALTHIDKSPLHFKHALSQHEESASLSLGRLVHTLVIEPDCFVDEFFLAPTFGRSKADLEKKASMFADNPGKTLINEDQWLTAQAMVNAVHASETCRQLLSAVTDGEITAIFNRCDVWCKARLDMITADIIVDLKTTRDASPAEFAKSAAKYNYWTQQEFYRHAMKCEGREMASVIIAVENQAPYGVGIYALSDHDLDRAQWQNVSRLKKYKLAVEVDEWAGYADQPTNLVMPTWAAYQMENEGSDYDK